MQSRMEVEKKMLTYEVRDCGMVKGHGGTLIKSTIGERLAKERRKDAR